MDLEPATSIFLWGLKQQNIKKQLLEIDVSLRKVLS